VRAAVTAGRAGPGGPSRQRPEAFSRRGTLGEVTAVALGKLGAVAPGEVTGVAASAALWQGFATLRQAFTTLRQAAALGE
jgi:hypothetical protein